LARIAHRLRHYRSLSDRPCNGEPGFRVLFVMQIKPSRRSLLFWAAPLISVVRNLRAQEAPTFSSNVKVVNILATAHSSKGEAVRDLTRDDFVLEEEGQPRAITYFSRANDLPLTLGLLVDTSGSERRLLGQEATASREFFHHVLREDRDQAFLIHFDREVEMLADLTSSRSKLDSALDSIDAPQMRRDDPNGGSRGGGYPGGGAGGGRRSSSGGTDFYDAVFLAADEVMKKQSGAKALLVLSDGVDTGSRKSLSSAIESAQRAETPVYTILFADHQSFGGGGFSGPGFGGGHGGRGGGRRLPPPSYDRVDGTKVLERMSKETGGTFFEVSGKRTLSDIYDRIEDDLRNQYSLGFAPDANAAGYRRIRLTAKQKGLVVTAREGYYAN